MKRNTKIVLAGLLITTIAAGGAFAAKGYQQKERGRAMIMETLKEADANSDSALSKEEMMTVIKSRFEKADSDSNGMVTRVEMVSSMESISGMPFITKRAGRISDRMVSQFDLDESGDVSMGEIENRAAKFFAIADWNDDGKVEMAEMQKLRELRMRGGRHHRGDRGNRGWWRSNMQDAN